MLKKVSLWINRFSRGWVALSGLIIFLLFIVFILPDQSSRMKLYSETAGSPDMSFYYSPETLYQMAEAYGEEGRRSYIISRFTFDIVWPLAYALFLCTCMSWFFQRAFPRESLWQSLNLVPVMGALFDFFENSSTSLVMARYPEPTRVVDVLAPIFTMIKWVLISGSFVLLLAGFAVFLWRSIKSHKNS